MQVIRTDIVLRPDSSRVLYRPFEPTQPQRAMKVISRVMELPDEVVEALEVEATIELEVQAAEATKS